MTDNNEFKPAKCEHCFFWVASAHKMDPWVGECVVRSVSTFPIRSNTEWCGEFHPRDQTIYPLWRTQ